MSTAEFNNQVLILQDSLFGIAYSLTKNGDDASDLCQDTILKALKYRSQYKVGTNLRSWVMTILRNTFYNSYKRQKMTNDIFKQVDDLSRINQNSNFSPESDYHLNEIQKKIALLDEMYRVPFMMHVEGYKYDEIAEELNVPQGTVKSRIFFARKFLSAQLEDYRN